VVKNGHEAKNDDEDDEADIDAATTGDVSSNDLGDVQDPIGGEVEDIDTGMCAVRMQEQLITRRSVTLSSEVFDKSAKNFVEIPAAPPPKMKIAIRMNIEGHDSGVQGSGWQRLYLAQPGNFDGSRRMTLRPGRFVRKLHLSGTGPLYKYLRYEFPTTVGAQTTRQPATKCFPPPPATILPSTTPSRSPARCESLRFGIEDIEELDSVVDDVRVQVDDRETVQDQFDDGRIGRHLGDDGEAVLVQDDGVGAVQNKVGGDDDDEGTGGVEEIPRIRSDTLRRPNVSYSTEKYDLSFVKTRSRRQLRRIN
jgi:hypothetical protein